MLTLIILAIIGFIVNFGVGLIVVRYTIGPGLGIIIGDGFPVWIVYVAIVLWPLVVLYWSWLVLTTIPRIKK